jgi:hypothetical protein
MRAQTAKPIRSHLKLAAIVAGLWLGIWFVLVIGVTLAVEDAGFLLDHIGEVPLLVALYAMVTAWFPLLITVGTGMAKELTREITRRTNDAVDWRWFWVVFLGAPAIMVAWAADKDHSFELLSLLAQVNATLIIAVVLSRTGLLYQRSAGPEGRTRRGVQLALLAVMTFGTLDTVLSAVIAQDRPDPGVYYDWALTLGHGFALAACFSALAVLIIDAGAHLLGLAENDADHAEEESAQEPIPAALPAVRTGSPPMPQPESAPVSRN